MPSDVLGVPFHPVPRSFSDGSWVAAHKRLP